MEVNVSNKPDNTELSHFLFVLLANFLTGVAVGVALGVSALLKTIIIESDSLIIGFIKDIFIPSGTLILFSYMAIKILKIRGFTIIPRGFARKGVAIFIGTIGFIVGSFLYLVIEERITTLYQASIGIRAERVESIFFILFIAAMLIIYQIFKAKKTE